MGVYNRYLQNSLTFKGCNPTVEKRLSLVSRRRKSDRRVCLFIKKEKKIIFISDMFFFSSLFQTKDPV